MKGDIMTVAAGAPVIRLIKLAYKADLSVLLHGCHGVGKSELLRAAAEELGIDVTVRDLSLMEPPDLIGLPRVGADGRTHYASPAFLPTGGKGLLVFEEINRAPRYMAAPCLQLLTARTLNDYVLPKGWLPCAAVNDADDGYQVDELDVALLSRFVRAKIGPDAKEWIAWAGRHDVHPKVVRFVQDNPNIFADPQSNPRSWTYVSRLLHASDGDAQATGATEDLVVAIAGLVGETWSGAFASYVGTNGPLSATAIVDAYGSHRGIVRRWREESRLDLLEATWAHLRNFLQRQADFEVVTADKIKKKNVERFLRDLTPDLLLQARNWLRERGLTGLSVPKAKAA
jgi:hypothetical protein